MKFFSYLHVINKVYSAQEVWFLAIILFFLPLAPALPLLLLLFVITAMLYRFFLRRYHTTSINRLLGVLGFCILIVDNSRVFSAQGIQHAAFFIAFITSLLTFGVTITIIEKRQTKFQNITPVLFWILSFFYNNTLGMLLYSLFALFTVTVLIISMQSRQKLFAALRPTTVLFLCALPIAVLLFFLFPRISSNEFDIGFKQTRQVRQGFDGKSSFSDAALQQQSNTIVMEVEFKKQVPPDNLLYFRGSVLPLFYNYEWLSLPRTETITDPGAYLSQTGEGVAYNVKLYPTGKEWLFALELGILRPKNTTTDLSFVLKNNTSLQTQKSYKQYSYLSYKNYAINESMHTLSLMTTAFHEPRTKQLAQSIKAEYGSDSQRLHALMQFFGEGNFTYTLKPSPHTTQHKVDNFLFDTKDGYCVHYAGAFVIMARYMGIPARIVTGYKAKRANSIGSFLLVRESDAHAWAEAYTAKQGWVRFDPTALIGNIDWSSFANASASNEKHSLESYSLAKNTLYFHYIKHLLERYILQFSYFDQISIFTTIEHHILLLFPIATIIAIAIGVIVFIVMKLNTVSPLGQREAFLNRIYMLLKKKGFTKMPHESAHTFLGRIAASTDNPSLIKELSHYCERILYEPNIPFDIRKCNYYMKALRRLRNLQV